MAPADDNPNQPSPNGGQRPGDEPLPSGPGPLSEPVPVGDTLPPDPEPLPPEPAEEQAPPVTLPLASAAPKQKKPRPNPLQRLRIERDEARKVVLVLQRAVRRLAVGQIPRMAAALAYRTIFSIIPVFVIGLLVFGLFASTADIKSAIDRAIDFLGFDQLVVEGTDADDENAQPLPDPFAGRSNTVIGLPIAMPPGEAPVVPAQPAEVEANPAPPETEDEPLPELQPVNAAAVTVQQLIENLVDRVQTAVGEVRFSIIGVVSVLVLLYAALTLLVEVERAFNQIYRAPAGRKWTNRLTLYWTVLTLGAMAISATFLVAEQFRDWTESVFAGDDGRSFLFDSVGFIATVAMSTLLLVIAYATVPNTRVKVRPALIGAVTAAILWEATKWGFRSYLGYSTGYQRFYGSLALLPLFLLWVYITWTIILFGLQVAYALQHFSLWSTDDDAREKRMVDPAAILAVTVAVAERFNRGETASLSRVANAVGLDEAVVDRMLDALVHAGVAHMVVRGERETFALARPPDQVRAADLLRLAEQGLASAVEDESGVLRRLGDARLAAVGDRTLGDLIREQAAHSDGREPHAVPLEQHAQAPAAGQADQAASAHAADQAARPRDNA